MGQLTIARFFMMHVAFLPLLMLAFIAAHVVALRQFGSVGPWKEELRAKVSPFWPDQVFKDVIVATLILLVLLVLSVYAIPPFTGPADPTDSSFIPKPEWNFLFFYQALKYFKGSLEPLGTLALPIVGTGILLLIPFLDRKPERNPLKRPFSMAFMAVSGACLIWLTLVGYFSTPAAVTPVAAAAVEIPAGQSPGVIAGAQVYNANSCAACHKINGTGGVIGPDLSDEGKKGHNAEWLAVQIRNPKEHNPNSVMTAYPNMAEKDLSNLVEYLQSLGAASSASKADPADPPANVTQGTQLFATNNCAVCHKINGAGGTIGPDLSNEANLNRTRDWLTTQLRNPKAHKSDSVMPDVAKLPDADVSAIVDYLMSLGAVSPAAPSENEAPASAPANAPPSTTQTSQPPANPAPAAPKPAAKGVSGEQVFKANSCAVCHKINGVGGTIGPDLSDQGNKGRSREWLAVQIRDPKAHVANSIMTPLPKMADADLKALIDYLLKQKTKSASPSATTAPAPATPTSGSTSMIPGTTITASSKERKFPVTASVGQVRAPGQAAFYVGSAEHGEVLYHVNCESCHGVRGMGNIRNPGALAGTMPGVNPINPKMFDRDPLIFAEKIDVPIQYGSIPSGNNPALTMPDYGTSNTLTQPEIADIEAYVLKLNGVDRAQVLRPGLRPHQFLMLTMLVLVVGSLGLAAINHWSHYRCNGETPPGISSIL